MKKAVTWIVIAAAVAGVLFLVFRPAGGGVKNVDSAGVVAAQNRGAQVIDVRSQGEYDLGHIPGAVVVPLETLQQAASNWDREATYVVYGANADGTAQAVKIMTAMGFKNIDPFTQGVVAWTGTLDKGSSIASETSQTNKPSAWSQKIKTVKTSGIPLVMEFGYAT